MRAPPILLCWSIKSRTLDSHSRRVLADWVADGPIGFARAAVILSTCERVEAYAMGTPPPPPPVNTATLWYSGNRAVEHLVRMASGLDSLIVGESEIRGQIRSALDRASDRGLLDAMTLRLFRSSLRASARVRAESGLDRICTSYARLATRRAVDAGPRVGVVGAGVMARATLGAINRNGAAEVTVFGRNAQRTRAVAARIGADACAMEDLAQKASALDALVTCVASPQAIVGSQHVRHVQSLRIIDLGIPANVDHSVLSRSGIEYIDLEALVRGCASPSHRVEQADIIVKRETEEIVRSLSRAHLLPPPRPWTSRSLVTRWKVA